MKKISLLITVWLAVLPAMASSLIEGIQRFREGTVNLPAGEDYYYLYYDIKPGYTVWQVYQSFVNFLNSTTARDWLSVGYPESAGDYYFFIHHKANTSSQVRTLRFSGALSLCTLNQYAALQMYTVTGNTQQRTVSLNGSQSGVSYRLKRSGSVLLTKNGTGSALTLGENLAPGVYTVEAVRGNETKFMRGEFAISGNSDNAIVTHTYRAAGGQSKISDYVFYDGWGRPLQRKNLGATPSGKDLIVPIVSDFLGRDVKTYLPYPATVSSSAYVADAVTAQNNYYKSLYGLTATNAYAYGEKRYESSGLNRLLEQGAPGDSHRLGNNHTQRFYYGTNAANDVRRFLPATAGLTLSGYYAASTLYSTERLDEDGNRSVVFRDYAGKIVLERHYAGTSEVLETYYVYDGLDRLVCVIPPAVNTSSSLSASTLDTYCYQYQYNSQGDLSRKKFPGIAAENYTYNTAHLVVTKSVGDKTFAYDYDSHNRLIREKCRYGSNTSFTVLAEYTYDTRPSGTGLDFTAVSGFDNTPDNRLQGSLVYEKIRVLNGNMASVHTGTPQYIERAYYYDAKGRLIQKAEKNQLGSISRYSFNYDFTGNALAEQESHTVAGVTTTVKRVNTYDHRDRLLRQEVFLNGTSKAVVAYAYNELGQLSRITYGNNLTTESKTYNIRGLLTGQSGSLFSMSFRYESPTKGKACYNGNISEWECKPANKLAQLYTFAYDGVNRFTGSDRYENGIVSTTYTEKGITYDKNGNLSTLRRTGSSTDVYNYVYTGNRLTSLSKNGVNGNFGYDVYGNMTSDSKNNLVIEYNFLNLWSKVTRAGAVAATYLYGSDGSKLSVSDAGNNGYVYLGSCIYQRTGSSLTFESSSFAEGRVSSSATYYHLKDHLGSVRVVFDQTGSVKEENDYYPFGLRQSRSDYAQLASNRFKYNGKEEQTTGGLGYLDYGFRMYAAEMGRWLGIDPLLEKYYRFSPYAYCGNNPQAFVDLDGRDWFRYKIHEQEEESWHWHEGNTYEYTDIYGEQHTLQGYSTVVVFEGSLSERLGTKRDHTPGLYTKNNAYIDGEGAVTARVTVYGSKGKDDIHTYTGYTMSSDPAKFGIVKDGLYQVSYDEVGKTGSLKSHWTLNKRGRVPTYWDNPYRPKQIDAQGNAYLTGVFIHRTNNDGWAGISNKHVVSKGCLLIAPKEWSSFNTQLEGVRHFMVEVKRKRLYVHKLPNN